MKGRFEYLDGLRGIAALIVVIHHGLILFTFGLYSGQLVDSRFSWDIRLSGEPFLLFFAGNFAVAIFFLLSGFVLSHVFSRSDAGPITLVIKRYVRLTIPIVAASLFAFSVAIVGLAIPAIHAYVPVGPGLSNLSAASVLAGLSFCLREAFVHATITGMKGGTYNGVLWTMQIEFYGSMLLIAMFWAARKLARSQAATLYYASAIAAVLLLLEYQSQLSLFLAGVLFYRLVHGRKLGESAAKEFCAAILLLGGLYLGTMPESPLRPELQNVLLRATGTDLQTMADHTVLGPLLHHFNLPTWVPFPFLPVPLWRGAGAVLVLAAVMLARYCERRSPLGPASSWDTSHFPCTLRMGT